MNIISTPGQVEVAVRLYSDAIRFRSNQGLWACPSDPTREFHKTLRSRNYFYHPERQDWTLMIQVAASQRAFSLAAKEMEDLQGLGVMLRFEYDRDLSFERDPANARADDNKLASVAAA